ncbi:MAG: hypothetical protein KAT58_12940 [candidate division Zixibacteria bacterium]|nr:hypothetical protein [candidate division Zixibacteria bacterium]
MSVLQGGTLTKISHYLFAIGVSLFIAMPAWAGEPAVISTSTFHCPGMSGFTFDYPVIRNWEPRTPVSKGRGRCAIPFNWPPCLRLSAAPQVVVETVPLSVVGTMFDVKSTNRYRVRYEKMFDPSPYISGYEPKPGNWDWLVFYSRNKAVRISRAQFGKLGGACAEKFNDFDEQAFYDLIIYTFKWTP